METPLVSVIIPTYNRAAYLARTIESVLAQTYSNWELVIVDDGSTDNTGEVVKAYNDQRITYSYQENLGIGRVAETRNLGLRKSRGELVAMLDSDDTWPAHRLEKQVPLFWDPNVVLCFGRGYMIDEADKVIGEVKAPRDLIKAENRPIGSVLHELLVSNFIFQISVLIRRVALDKVGGFLQPSGLLAEDYPTFLALALLGEFRYVDLPLGNYRIHQGQMTRKRYLEMVQTDIPYAMEFFRSLSPKMQEKAGWAEAGLAKALSDRLNNAYFAVGRRDLLAQDWGEARQHFLTAFLRGNLKTKAKAFLGLWCSLLHVDTERIIRLSGGTPLR